MNKIRLSSFLLTLAMAVILLGYMNPSFAGKKCDEDPNHPSCGDDDEVAVVYTVELRGSAFEFASREVTLNSKGILKSDLGLVMSRPVVADGEIPAVEQDAWDLVVATCGGALSDDVDDMFVDFNDWGVYRNSDNKIGINISDIFLPDAIVPAKEIQINLSGIPGADYLPASQGGWNSFTLEQYAIWGKPLSGPKRSWDTCFHSSGDASGVINLPPSQLIITRISP